MRLRRLLAAGAVLVPLTAGGCAPWLQRPLAGLPDGPLGGARDAAGRAERPLPCAGGRDAAGVPAGFERDAVAIGPLRFRGLAPRHRPARFRPGAPTLPVLVLVPAWRRVTVHVPPDELGLAGLDTGPVNSTGERGPHRAVRCGAGARSRVFTLYFAVREPRCVDVSVTQGRSTATRAVPFGVPRC